jgi:NAD(P)-dependent dehydrogenase (short-subunit alcohol dehydrogenase family)
MMRNDKSFQDNVAIITGAASGIGQAVALDLYKAGAKIVAVDLKEEHLAKAFTNETHGDLVLVQGNVSRGEDRRKILDAAIDLGGPDFLINAAGIIRIKDIFEVTEDIWDEIQDVNAKACFFMCQAVGDYWMKNGKKGVIVNFSSSAGKTASTTQIAPYNASKASVIAITKSFAYALAPAGCRVNCVCPGLIKTPMQQALKIGLTNGSAKPEDIANQRLRMVPMGREGTPEEVSKVVQFLLSDSASYMTGQAINITGGMVMY